MAEATEQARRLLGEAPIDPLRGVALLKDAAEADGEAAALMAVLAGAGAGVEQSWEDAFAWLRRAERLGWADAARQLQVLEALPLADWLAPPRPRFLSQSPYIGVFDAFLPPKACEALIDLARPKLKRATVYHPASGEGLIADARSNSTADLGVLESDLVLVMARERIAIGCGVHPLRLEPPAILHYAVGEAFTPHYDFMEPGDPAYARDLERKGQRMGTFLCYLNTGFEGGETDFPQLPLRYRGGTGDALFFANVLPSGAPDRRTLHAGLPPTSGEKWLLSQWIRTREQVRS